MANSELCSFNTIGAKHLKQLGFKLDPKLPKLNVIKDGLEEYQMVMNTFLDDIGVSTTCYDENKADTDPNTDHRKMDKFVKELLHR